MMNIIRWIKHGSDCEKCKWMWETCYSNEDGTEYDCGCWIKGVNYDDTYCRLVNPVKFIVGCCCKKKTEYWEEHQYDECLEWYEKDQKNDEALLVILNQYLGKYDFYVKHGEEFNKVDLNKLLGNEVTWIRSDYEEVSHPIVHKSIATEWKELIIKTWNAFLDKFRPYFSK